MTEELHEVSIEAGRRRELARRKAEDAIERVRQDAFGRPQPYTGSLEEWKDQANAHAAAVERENARRRAAEVASAQTVAVDIDELQQIFKAGADTIEALEAENERLRAKISRMEKRYKAVKRGMVEQR
jgi:hypothetical protein